jgi:cytochrome c biogenesis protein CcmG, thiol:disulfide interchange protein DsbE
MIDPCLAIQWNCRIFRHFTCMKSAKTDRVLRAAMGLLMVALVYVIYAAIHERVVVAGDSAPEFSVRAENGRTVSLPNFGGKVLILNFWASWCPPCVQETPTLSEFATQYADKGVVVLGISVDKDEKAYRAFLQKFRPNFLTVRELQIHEEYGTFMYPETYIIDRNGRVLKKIVDPADWPGNPARFEDWSDPAFAQYIQSLL